MLGVQRKEKTASVSGRNGYSDAAEDVGWMTKKSLLPQKFVSLASISAGNQPYDVNCVFADLNTVYAIKPSLGTKSVFSSQTRVSPSFFSRRNLQKKTRFEVFRRLNKFGSPLSDQEIRNCTARLLGKEFPDQLRLLAEKPLIREVLALSEEAFRRMGAEEALLRLLALTFSEQKLKHQIREYLDDFMEFAAEGKFKLTQDIEHRIEKSFAVLHEAVPDGQAFRLRNQGFSTNLFDIVATGVFHNIDILTVDTLKNKLTELHKSSELKNFIGSGSNTRKKMQGRIDFGKRWFRK